MYTGIVQGVAKVIDIQTKNNLRELTIEFPAAFSHHFETGASISINGCCLTIVSFSAHCVRFDVMYETLDKTTLGSLNVGDLVNFERAAKFGDEIGGHLMSGHITTTAEIIAILHEESRYKITFKIDSVWMKYILYKGFVAIDGMSLTVGDITDSTFEVNLIPETLARTTIKAKKCGERVNIELDPQTQAIVDTVERIMQK